MVLGLKPTVPGVADSKHTFEIELFGLVVAGLAHIADVRQITEFD